MSDDQPEASGGDRERVSAGNPAQILAVTLGDWEVTNGSHPEVVRGMEEDNQLEFWRNQARASELVREVDYVLQGMNAAGEDVSMYLALLPRVYAAVFSFPAPWTTVDANQPRPLLSPIELDLLRALGAYMNAHGELRVTPQEQATLRRALDEAERLVLDSPDTLDVPARRYIWQLIVEAINTLDDIEQFGSAPVRNASFQLAGAMSEHARVLEEAQQPEKASMWTATRDKITGALASEAVRRVLGAGEWLAKRAIENGS